MFKQPSFRGTLFSALSKTLFIALFSLMGIGTSFGHDLIENCPEPSPVLSSQSSNSVVFGWTAIGGADGYEVYYTRAEDNYSSSVIFTTQSSVGYNNLPAGTYRFHFRTICDGGVSGYIITEEMIMF